MDEKTLYCTEQASPGFERFHLYLNTFLCGHTLDLNFPSPHFIPPAKPDISTLKMVDVDNYLTPLIISELRQCGTPRCATLSEDRAYRYCIRVKCANGKYSFLNEND